MRKPGSSFRLTRVGSTPVLLTPAVPERQPEAKPIKVALRDAGSETCSIEGDLFGFSAGKGVWTLRLPAIDAWRDADGTPRIEKALGAFLSRVESGCLDEAGRVRAAGLIEESLPGPPLESLYSLYRFRLGDGFIDLKPGASIKVERAHFRPGQPQNLANYLGTTALTFECLAGKQGGLMFRPDPILRDPADLNIESKDLPESRLPNVTKALPYYRLFVLNDFVPKGFQRAAVLVGAKTRGRIEEITQALRARPETTCTESPLAGADCVMFEGKLTVSSGLTVMVNGKPRTVAAATTLRSILGRLVDSDADLPARLRFERLYAGRYMPVRFEKSDKAVFDMPLIAGDRLTF